MLEAGRFAQIRIPPGEPGIWQSVRIIQRLIPPESARPVVRAYAALIGQEIAPDDHDGRLLGIRRFVGDHMRYLPDPVGVEAIGLPSYHLEAIRNTGGTAGDCDDAAALTAALARSSGRPVRLAVASFYPSKKLHHIWTEARGSSGWVDLDPFREERFEGRPTRLHLIGV